MKLATNKEGKLRQCFSQQEVARALRLDTRTVRAMIERGELTAYLTAGKIRIHADELERYLTRVRIGRLPRPETHPQTNYNL